MDDNIKVFPEDVSVSKGVPWPPHNVLVSKVRRSSIWASFAAITAGVFMIIEFISAVFFGEESWKILYAIHPALAYILTSLFLLVCLVAGIFLLVDEVKSLKNRKQYPQRMVMPYWYHLCFSLMMIFVPAYWLLKLMNSSFVGKLETLTYWICGIAMLAILPMLWAGRKEMRPIFRWALYVILALLILTIVAALYVFVTKGL